MNRVGFLATLFRFGQQDLIEDLTSNPFERVTVVTAQRKRATKDRRAFTVEELAGGRTAARQVRGLESNIQSTMELRSVDAIVSMVSEGMGVTVLPLPRRPMLQAYELKEIGLGRTTPFRRISLVWRRADDDNRKVAAVADAFNGHQSPQR